MFYIGKKEAVQYLRPKFTNWNQNFTMWEGFLYTLRFHDVWGHTASNEEIPDYGGCPISQAPIDQMRPKLHHMGRLLIYLRVPWCLRPHSLYLQNSGIWKLSNIYGLKQHGIYPKPSHMVDNWGLRYWTASIFFYKNIFFRGYMASNIMDSQNISKMLPYGEVLILIGQLRP